MNDSDNNNTQVDSRGTLNSVLWFPQNNMENQKKMRKTK